MLTHSQLAGVFEAAFPWHRLNVSMQAMRTYFSSAQIKRRYLNAQEFVGVCIKGTH